MAKGEEKALRPKRAIERRGLAITGACVLLVAVLVLTLIFMVASRGLATFTTDGIPFASFMAGTSWNPHQNDANGIPLVGALPMIAGSFSVTLLSCLIALPFALGSAIFVVEVNPTFGTRVFQPLTELLVGIPSVVFGLVGLEIIVPWTRSWAGGTGYGILSGSIVLAFMILPTVTSLSIDAIRAVPQSYRDGSYGLGCTRWQTIAHVVLPSASSGILTAVILGMTRAFGEALAVQMVVGNAAQIPTSLTTPAATLTSVITTSMGNEAMGTVYNDVLWSLALVLLIMSLVFILIIHIIGRKGRLVASSTASARARRQDHIATGVLTAIVAVICVALVAIIVYIVGSGAGKLFDELLTGKPQQFKAGGGIGPELFNSFYLLVLTLLLSLPLSLGAAIYLAEYAHEGPVTTAAKTIIETLSSLPSIVVGLFGMLFFVLQLGWGFSIMSGALALTMFNLPILTRVIQQALEAVPRDQRDAGLALGLTRWETTIHIPIPSAMPAIVTGVILSAGRVFGEAAALIYTAGQSAPMLDFTNFDLSSASCPWNVWRPAETLAVHIWKINSEGVVPDLAAVSSGTAAVLMVCILAFNIIARIVGRRLERRLTAE